MDHYFESGRVDFKAELESGRMDYYFVSRTTRRTDHYFDLRRSDSVCDVVSSVLKVLEIILCWFDDFGSGMDFSSLSEKRDIQIMYRQLKQMESLCTYYSTDECWLSCSWQIDMIVREARYYIFSHVDKFARQNIDKQATSSTAQSTSIHVLETMLRISDKEEHFVLYDAVVSLLSDLQLILSSHGHTCDSEQQFRKGDIQIMYDNLSMMDSLLVDSSGQAYDKNLINGSEHWVGLVAYRGRDYIDLWPQSLIEKQSTGSLPPPSYEHIFPDRMNKLTQKMVHVNQQLIRLTENQPIGSFPPPYKRNLLHYLLHKLTRKKYVKPDLIGLTEKQPTGSLPPPYKRNLLHDLLHKLTRKKSIKRDLIGLTEKQPTGSLPPPYKHIFDDRLRELTSTMEFINQDVIVGLTEKQLTGSSPPSSEHIFELHGTTSTDGAAQVSCQNLHQITKIIEFVNSRLKRIREGRDTQSLQGTSSTGQVFVKLNKLSRMPNEGGKLVGFKNDLSEMLDRLTGYPPKLQVLTVVGMGGIGKTTFTESLYDDPLVKYQFHIRAWFTISQQYQVKEVLVGLLRCLTNPKTEIYGKSKEDLEQALYQCLKGEKYLIVLDDMWDKQAWNDLKRIFPNDGNGSRIILTTRLIDVAEFASPDTQPRRLPHLSPDESWELLRSKILINELCPPELEPIGRQIARKCQGLPLAIVVVAGLLSKMSMTLEVWKDVAKSVCSIVMEEQEQCQNILSLSYNHLPDHLKPCFLYMGNFPEDSKIPAKKLIWLWIGEGFIRPRKLKSLEEVAENYLEDLIGRSLVQVNRRRYDGRFKTCFLHDMLRDLCLRESHEQRFFLVFHKNLKSMTEKEKENFMSKCQRVCFHSNTLDTTTVSWLKYTRSFLWFKTITSIDLKSCLFMNLERLKVLDVIDGHLEELPRDIVPILANFRYMALSFQNSIDRSIFGSVFHNIQILVMEGEWNGQLPKEFWTMSELRHFYLKRSFSSYWPEESRPNIMQLASASESPQTLIYPVQYEEHSIKVLQNLQSLTTIRPISCTDVVFLSMPNLKKLGVFENEEDCGLSGWFKNLVHLKELQTLKYVFCDPFVLQSLKPDRLPSQNFIPVGLINLTISGTGFPWEDMLKLCALPKLEVLKLKNHAFFGPTWTLDPDSGVFPCLRYLFIRTTNLQSWEADDTHFPKLQHLVMMTCRRLKEIPHGIFESPLLERIELHNCSETTVDSAEQLQHELLENGNDSLELYVTPDRRQR